ncbi:MAG: T9SS type A sorting domain-containing protein [Bacteroidia bacterium]|nr:T9SS type A sorting domain-containing protein [Bacteroidia bacterium]
MILHVKKYFIFCALILVSSLGLSQTTTFTAYGAPHWFGTTNAFAEDTLNSILHFQYSCNCGVGPGNQWSTFNQRNVITNATISPVYYGPYGTRYISKDLLVHNNRVYVNDRDFLTARTAPSYTPQNWVHNTTFPEKIMAYTQRNDTLFVIKDDGSNCNSLVLINANTGAIIPYTTVECITSNQGTLFGEVLKLKASGSKLYVVGTFTYYNSSPALCDTNSLTIDIPTGTVTPLHLGVNDTIHDIEIYNNKIHVAGSFTQARGQIRNRYAAYNTSLNLLSGTPSFNARVKDIEVHDHYLFANGDFNVINGNSIGPAGVPYVKSVNLNTNSIMNWSFSYSGILSTYDTIIMKKFRNRIYLVNKNQSGAGIEMFCLPPIKSTTVISTATTTICENSVITFSVPAFKYASSYNWWYTGTGATGGGTGNAVSFNFGFGSTSGKLKMVSLSACGGVSDTLSVNITILPRPSAIASLVDDTLNCFKPKVPLLGNSFSPNVGYTWNGPSGYFSNQQNDSTGLYLPGNYTVTVTSFTSGCSRTATVNVKLDTIKPNVTLPAGPYIIPCNPASLLLNGTSTTTPTSLQWYNQAAASTLYTNPHTVTAPGNYVLLVQNLYNGCKNRDTLTAILNNAVPSVTVTSYPSYTNIAVPADTLTCFQPTLSINAVFSPTNCTIQWKEVATNSLFPNPITVSTQGYYIPVVTRLDNNCTDASKIIFITQDKLPPNLSLSSASSNINCSYATATLSAVSSTSNTTLQWTGPSSFNAPNPAVTSVQGWYYVTATNSLTGCVRKDSVIVGYSNTLVVNAGNDILSCKNSPATLSAVVAGTVSPITYAWSNGGNTQTISVTTNTTTNYIVNVSGGGCSGTDTVKVIIPSDIQDSVVTSKGCTGNSGSLVIYAWGGIAPYVYSVNGGPFVSTNTFTNLAFGSHSIVIKDSLGCIRNTSASINQNSNSVSPVFIVSTQNFKGDTVVFVDITVPKADSVSWILPSIASIIGGDMFSPVVVFGDTGTFAVTLQAYYGTCMISATKNIRILPYDTAYANFTNANGIKSISVNPNPNNGQFTAQVEFYKKQNASIQVWDATAQKHFQQNFYEVSIISLPVNLSNLQNGTYILKVIGEYNAGHFNFIISK